MSIEIATIEQIEAKIHLLRGQRVMLDSDLAGIYGVQLKRLNEQVTRNADRFPSDFAFQLTRQELMHLKSQFATSSSHGGKRKPPRVFTEHGALMLASVLNSGRAVEMSVFVVRAFVRMRQMLMSNRRFAAKLDELERRVSDHDEVIADLFKAIRELLNPAPEEPTEPDRTRREIGFHVKEQARQNRVTLKTNR